MPTAMRGIALEVGMNRQAKEYDLGELIDNPGLGLAMEYEGADRGWLALLFEGAPRGEERHPPQRLDPPFLG
jgi:hypothetical protein